MVEIAFDGVQTSPRYPGGVALRFARVLRYRDDKTADEADTLRQRAGPAGALSSRYSGQKAMLSCSSPANRGPSLATHNPAEVA